MYVYIYLYIYIRGFPCGAKGKEPACQCRCKRCGFNPWVQKIPCSRAWQLEHPMDRRAWGTTVYGVTKSWTQLK